MRITMAAADAKATGTADSETQRPFEQWRGQVYTQLADLRRKQRQRELAQWPGVNNTPGDKRPQ